jgi:glutaredoxin
MTIDVYSKKGCGVCEAAKEKLNLMGLPYRSHEMERFMEFHEGWREDGSVEVLAAYAMFDNHLPLIRIDGQYFDYAGAMSRLRQGASGSGGRSSGTVAAH